jgi:hypothetical protein
MIVIPAQAGIQKLWPLSAPLDPGLRRDDGPMSLIGALGSGAECKMQGLTPEIIL